MSWNANTQYKAVDLDQLAQECKQAISKPSLDQWWGEDLHQWPLEASVRRLKDGD